MAHIQTQAPKLCFLAVLLASCLSVFHAHVFSCYVALGTQETENATCKVKTNFTVGHATKVQKESRGKTLLFLTSVLD